MRTKALAGLGVAAALALATGCSTDTGAGGAGTPDVQSEAGTLADTADAAGTDTGTADTGTADGGSTDAGGTDAGTVDAGGTPAAWTACTADSDCLPLELACCDHCNGGKLGAFHKSYLAEAKAALAPSAGSCSGAMCTEMACGPAVAWCEGGVCAAGPDPGFGKSCGELDEAACKASKSCAPMTAWTPAASCNNEAITPVYKGCMSNELGCGDAETCAADPTTGELWVFPSTCLPKGWTAKSWEACCPTSGGTCSAGNPAEIGKLCLQPKDGATTLEVGKPFDVVVMPKGCFSSSCTKVHEKSCTAAIDEAGALVIGAQVCLENTGGPGVPCTADCSGAGQTSCAAPALAAGSYQATLGGLKLSFEVPSKAGAELCVGQQF